MAGCMDWILELVSCFCFFFFFYICFGGLTWTTVMPGCYGSGWNGFIAPDSSFWICFCDLIVTTPVGCFGSRCGR